MKKLVLAVVDAMKPAMLERAVASGKAPALELLIERGEHVDDCVAAFPSVTPVCAATIATGTTPDRHLIPSMNWYHRGEGRYVEYGTSFRASQAFGFKRSLTDTIYNMNLEHLSSDVETVFESLDDADVRTAGTTYLMYRGRHEHRERRQQDREPRGGEGGGLGVERERTGGVRFEPGAHPAEQRACGDEAERRGAGADDDPRPPCAAAVGDGSGGREGAEHEGDRRQDVGDGAELRPTPALDEAQHGDENDDRQQEARLLEKAEARAVEVDADVAGGERADEQRGQERPDADPGGDSKPLEQVEEVVHGLACGRGA